MIICKHCDTPFDHDYKYCPWCGNYTGGDETEPQIAAGGNTGQHRDEPGFCGACGAKIPTGVSSCLVCGWRPGEPLKAFTPPIPSPAPKKEGAKSNRGVLSVCFLLCSLMSFTVVLLLASRILPVFTMRGKSVLNDSVLYISADEKLKIKSPLLDSPLEIISNFTSDQADSEYPLSRPSIDGRYLAYLNGYENGEGSLYVIDFKEVNLYEAKPPKEIFVAGGVTNAFFFANYGSSLVYLKSTGELCITDYTVDIVLDTEVTHIYDNTDTRILYEKSLDAKRTGLCMMDLAAQAGAALIDENIVSLVDYTPGFETFIYTREQQGGSLDIISRALYGNSITLAADVHSVISADAEKQAALYVTESDNTLGYEDIIIDEYLQNDMELDEPDLTKYPLLSEYYDRFGSNDVSAGILEREEALAEESLAFNSVIEAYDAKLARDGSRTEIIAEISRFVSQYPKLYDLHMIYDGVSTRLADGSYTPYRGAVLGYDAALAVFTVTSFADTGKIAILDYERAVLGERLNEHLINSLSDSFFICASGGRPMQVRAGGGPVYSKGLALLENGSGAYFAIGRGSPVKNHETDTCSLYYAPISAGAPGQPALLDDAVAGLGEMLDGDRILYYKERNGNMCDLYVMTGTQSRQIGDGVPLLSDLFKISPDKKTLLYCERFNTEQQSGNLFAMAGEPRQLAGNVRRAYFKGGGMICFLRGAKERSSLYAFDVNGLSLIDDNVASVIE